MAGSWSASSDVMVWVNDVFGLFVIISLLLAACADIATRTIPNFIPAIVAGTGIIARVLTGPSALAVSTAASVVLFASLLILHGRGLLGGGDIKLIPATALGFSVTSIYHFVFVTVMAGGVLAAIHLFARWLLRGRPPAAPPPRGSSLPRRVFSAERWRIARHGSLPYGVAIACGGIWVIIRQAGS